MKRILVAVLSLSIFALGAPALAESDCATKESTLNATGAYSIEVEPDIAIVSVSIETEAPKPTAKSAASENSVRSDKVVQAIKRELKDGESVKTVGYGVHPVYVYRESDRRNDLVGYRATNQITVKLRRINLAGDIADIAIKSGANRVNDIRFEVEEIDKPCKEALDVAAKKATDSATSIAKSFGLKVLGVKTITPSCSAEGQFQPHVFTAESVRSGADFKTPIEPGTRKVFGTINAVFLVGQ